MAVALVPPPAAATALMTAFQKETGRKAELTGLITRGVYKSYRVRHQHDDIASVSALRIGKDEELKPV